ncbi:carcinine hydrolase/isopenicillin-N N-acyltransferase family protein [Mesorhizobium sp. M7A.F.Ca.ET.027.02.1.1]|uniref:carcinine hydrolase/isopenicillin-N N-acyltransferase family protein n=1 Tax=Mesorhizobium sp. M7A.F.Ca.ET.027.02.1.1 TaxID=2496655 RepID=UPI001FDF23C9|nr:carcinine hydrolase/isopenicillin-N N-acyltransferase family protein [Mesorhizobium sp. M7A.F.Ca.ET.027.02.1.1]
MYPGQLLGHTFGLNEAGLVQTVNNISAHDLQPGASGFRPLRPDSSHRGSRGR